MAIKISRLKKYNPSMSVPGNGKVERPLGAGNQQGGRDSRSARHYADAMDAFGGGASDAGYQYSNKGEDSR